MLTVIKFLCFLIRPEELQNCLIMLIIIIPKKLLIILNFTAIFFNFSLFQLKTATIFCSSLLSKPVTPY